MPRQRGDQAGVAACRAEHTGNMHQRLDLRHVNQRRQLALVAVGVKIVEQARLLSLHQLCHRDSGVNVGHRVVGVAVFDAVSDGQMLQPEAR